MIYLIIKAIIPFILILAFSIFSFSVIYWVLFYSEVENFKSLELAFRTTFHFAIGGIDFSIFPDESGIGTWLTMIWTFISTISLLNIMIALLGNEFADVTSTTNAYYVSFIYSIWVYNRYVPGFGGVVALPTPLNFMLMMIGPFYRMGLLCKKKLDKAL